MLVVPSISAISVRGIVPAVGTTLPNMRSNMDHLGLRMVIVDAERVRDITLSISVQAEEVA
jgi:hypothetical protein